MFRKKKKKHIGDVVNVKPFILNVFSPVDPELCNIWSQVGDEFLAMRLKTIARKRGRYVCM